MTISVLIATRDRPAALYRCLESVARQDHSLLEILVIDDAPATPIDEAALYDAAGGRPVRCLHSAKRLGPAGCRNVLMQQARGDVFLILDDDACFIGAPALEHIIATFDAYPDVGILAFKLFEEDENETRLLLPHGRRHLRKHPHEAEQVGLVGHYLAGGHALRRSVVEHCGYFEDDLFYGHEELDLAYRALDAGFSILYLPTVVVQHFPDTSVRGLSGWKLYYSLRNRIQIAYTYLPARYVPVHVGFWLAWYSLEAVRYKAFSAYWHGLRDGLTSLKQRDRRPLQPRTIAYLKAHRGRLWF